MVAGAPVGRAERTGWREYDSRPRASCGTCSQGFRRTTDSLASVVSLILVPLSTKSGENLEERIEKQGTLPEIKDLIEEHEELADWLIWLVLVMTILAIVGYLLHRSGNASQAVAVTVAVLSVLSAATVAVQVARIGHAGAKAAWYGCCVDG